MLSSREYYDALAQNYDQELKGRSSYIEAVNESVIQWIAARRATTLVDVGCGNAQRLQDILSKTGVMCTGIDESPNMVERARGLGIDAYVMDIADVQVDKLPRATFDLVIALWNVLGHIPGEERRRRALLNMRSLLSSGGVVLLDVNNRYNAAQYGWWRVINNLGRDFLFGEKSGNFVIRRTVARRMIATTCRVLCLREMLFMCREAGLRPIEVRFINYDTGLPASNQWSGQLLVVAESVE